MKKKSIFVNCITLVLFMVVSFTFVSCSSDENDKDVEVTLDTDNPQEIDGISISFQLLNPEGIAVKSFKEGEEIIFRLTISNTREEKVILPPTGVFLGGGDGNLFRVYTSDNKDMGKPWDQIITEATAHSAIDPKSSRTFSCPWVGMPNGESAKQFIKQDKRNPLPKGHYYSQFEIIMDNQKKVLCKKEFKI